jgi:hypothetical protein
MELDDNQKMIIIAVFVIIFFSGVILYSKFQYDLCMGMFNNFWYCFHHVMG